LNCIGDVIDGMPAWSAVDCTFAIYYITDTVQESWVVTQQVPLVEQELFFSFLFWALCCLSFDLQILITTMPKIKRKKKVPAPLVAPVVLQPMILELYR
jgi:hypothetical protein